MRNKISSKKSIFTPITNDMFPNSAYAKEIKYACSIDSLVDACDPEAITKILIGRNKQQNYINLAKGQMVRSLKVLLKENEKFFVENMIVEFLPRFNLYPVVFFQEQLKNIYGKIPTMELVDLILKKIKKELKKLSEDKQITNINLCDQINGNFFLSDKIILTADKPITNIKPCLQRTEKLFFVDKKSLNEVNMSSLGLDPTQIIVMTEDDLMKAKKRKGRSSKKEVIPCLNNQNTMEKRLKISNEINGGKDERKTIGNFSFFSQEKIDLKIPVKIEISHDSCQEFDDFLDEINQNNNINQGQGSPSDHTVQDNWDALDFSFGDLLSYR